MPRIESKIILCPWIEGKAGGIAFSFVHFRVECLKNVKNVKIKEGKRYSNTRRFDSKRIDLREKRVPFFHSRVEVDERNKLLLLFPRLTAVSYRKRKELTKQIKWLILQTRRDTCKR